MIVLGIETTCDETACSLVKDGKEILSNVVSSQIPLHEQFGGVVPELACRTHCDRIMPVILQALENGGVALRDIDLIAVARGPGLIGALMIGINAAKALSWSLGIPYIGVNHIEAHLYASLMSQNVAFPAIGAVLSGGHTSLVYMKKPGQYELIGQTVDDAIGEAFDKVAKILGLPYPGGPHIEKLAEKGAYSKYSFNPGRVKGSVYDFSFSGLKTAVLYAAKGPKSTFTSPLLVKENEIPDIAFAFQMTALKDVVNKTVRAAEEYQCSSVVFGGGVTCNQKLREMFASNHPHLEYFWPSQGLCMDNAAMIAGLGSVQYAMSKKGDPLDMEASVSINF